MRFLAPTLIFTVRLRHHINQRQLDSASRLPFLNKPVADGEELRANPGRALPIGGLEVRRHSMPADEFLPRFLTDHSPNLFCKLRRLLIELL